MVYGSYYIYGCVTETLQPAGLVQLCWIEVGIIRGGNWAWLLNSLNSFNIDRENITLIAMLENIHSAIKSDYVAEYYDDEKEELMFYFEKFNKHWPIK